VYGILIGVFVLLGFAICAVVLMQSGKGGGLAAMGGGATGTESAFGGKQAAGILTKSTWWLGGIFLGLSLLLSTMSGAGEARESILRGDMGQTAPAGPVTPDPTQQDLPAEQAPAAPQELPVEPD